MYEPARIHLRECIVHDALRLPATTGFMVNGFTTSLKRVTRLLLFGERVARLLGYSS